MSNIRAYLARIGRRGGIKSRRTLEPDVARRMVEIREARRVARRASTATQPGGAPADTSITALAVHDALLRRASPAEKLAQVARLSRTVDQLSVAGLRQRHPTADGEMIAYRRAELRLGRELAARVYGARDEVPNELHDPVAIALDIAARLDQLRVEWLIGGSLASSVHGEPRATQDVDMVVALHRRHVKPLWEAFRRDYYVDVGEMRSAVRTLASFNAIHFASAIKVDFFVAGADPFETERLATRQRIETPGGVIYVDTAENTLLRKLEWYRRGGETSERQWRDVQAIARIQGDRLDRDRLRLWADQLGVMDLLQRILVQRD